MKYLIRIFAMGELPEIEITKDEYAEFRKARTVLSNALAIEEKYEIIIRNYVDFEKQVLDITLAEMIREDFRYSSFFEARLSLNVRLVNLLTAARLYVDQVNQNIRECIPDVTDSKDAVKSLFSDKYDNHKEYRFMETLRNYVQHRGLPVHHTQFGSRWTSLDDDGLMEFSMELASDPLFLEENGGFKKVVLDEWNGKIDLKQATRKYVELFSEVQEAARAIIAESVTAARKLIEEAQNRYRLIHSGSLAGLSACKCPEEGEIIAIPLLLDWDDIRIGLEKRNRKLVNLSRRYVTSSVKTSTKQA